MRQEWTPEDVVACWTLGGRRLGLVANKGEAGTVRLLSLVAEDNETGTALLAALKRDPGTVGRDSLLTEITKLNDVRGLGLREGLFADCSEKLVAAWRARAIIVATGEHGESEAALRHVRRHFITVDNLRAAVTRLVNGTFAARDAAWWGQGTACASDSKKSGSWSSNFMTEYHARYGTGVPTGSPAL